MENTNTEFEHMCQNFEQQHKRGKIFGGILITIAGSLFLARELGAELPAWIFSWKMLLISIGLLIGVKHRFRRMSWIVLVLIGSAFLIADVFPTLSIKPILWPILIILLGVFIIFKPRRKNKLHRWKKWQEHKLHHYQAYTQAKSTPRNDDNYFESTSFMGAVKKNIVSKDFKGGEITVVFGGAELNLSQADFNESITLEINQVFGGTRLIIPAHWEIKSELVSVLGSIEDKRQTPSSPILEGSNKKLILRGTTVFGGIEITNY